MLATMFLIWIISSLVSALFLGFVLGNLTDNQPELALQHVASDKIIPFSKVLQNVS